MNLSKFGGWDKYMRLNKVKSESTESVENLVEKKINFQSIVNEREYGG